MMMNMQHIRAFYEVACERSFSRAAQKLHFAQSTITDQIKLLERELGVSLFRRRGSRAIELTNEGRLLWPYAQEILATEANARRAIVRSQPRPLETASFQ